MQNTNWLLLGNIATNRKLSSSLHLSIFQCEGSNILAYTYCINLPISQAIFSEIWKLICQTYIEERVLAYRQEFIISDFFLRCQEQKVMSHKYCAWLVIKFKRGCRVSLSVSLMKMIGIVTKKLLPATLM